MKIIFLILLCFLSVYGVFELMMNFLYSSTPKNDVLFSHKVIGVTDSSINIEYEVRYNLKKGEEVVLIDYSSLNETKNILKFIQKEFSNVKIINPDQYTNFIIQQTSFNE